MSFIIEKIKKLFKKDSGRHINEDENNDEGEVFRLLTPKLLTSFEAMRTERRKKIKEAENKQIVMQERIVDGEVTYTAANDDENEEDDDYLYDEFYDGRDPQLIEGFQLELNYFLYSLPFKIQFKIYSLGNKVPIKLGLLPKQIYQRPAIEIDPYIHKKDDTFVVISKRFRTPQIYRFSSTKSLNFLTPFNKFRKALIWFVSWQ